MHFSINTDISYGDDDITTGNILFSLGYFPFPHLHLGM